MDRTNFDREMGRLAAIIPAPVGDEVSRRALFLDQLFDSFRNINAAIFRDVVTKVFNTHGGSRHLIAKEFWTAYAAIRADKGGDLGTKCSTCGGSGWTPVCFVQRLTGRPASAAHPCRACNGQYQHRRPVIAGKEVGPPPCDDRPDEWDLVRWDEYNQAIRSYRPSRSAAPAAGPVAEVAEVAEASIDEVNRAGA